MLRSIFSAFLLASLTAVASHAQGSAASSAAGVWNALSSPTMDPAKSAQVQNVEIVRDRVRITLANGTIQFTQPVNGVVFGAVFHGSARLHADPPNPIETQQLYLFSKQEKLNLSFTDATFSFTDAFSTRSQNR